MTIFIYCQSGNDTLLYNITNFLIQGLYLGERRLGLQPFFNVM